ncbi:hypothetical protein Z965_02395 [Clostridium novyi A str. BKT29909]|uniref:hypothetical protein n=1 Tax=Clostridium novyi TaxID=1542 RepID=UPI0004D529B1|nr:hypothetical protein [Clostridium novyi]KEH89612.1 hypothetical protein Z965_02395 [Clostridium novyi A str. BKT29909]
MNIKNILDIIAIIVSIASAIFSFKATKVTKKVANKTLNKKFFEDIYFNEIIEKLPYTLSKIQSKEGRLSKNCNDAIKIIMRLLDKSKFYKYFDEKFYGEISGVLIELDENLVLMCDEKLLKENLEKYISKTQALTNKFYSILRQYYFEI